MHKCPLHLNMCYHFKLPWEIWSDILSRKRSTYMYILMIYLIATNTTGSYCLKNHQTCCKLHYHYTTSSKCSPTRTKISDVDELKRRINNEWSHLNHVVHWTVGAIIYALVFALEADVSSIWCRYDVWLTLTTRLTIFETITASRVCAI